MFVITYYDKVNLFKQYSLTTNNLIQEITLSTFLSVKLGIKMKYDQDHQT